MQHTPSSPIARWVDQIERYFIAITLGLMCLITFGNVIVRHVFNSNWTWALESTVFLFAWLVIIGASHCVKNISHLGVDVIAQLLSPKAKRLMGLVAVSLSLLYAALLLFGAWDYWQQFYTQLSFLEVDDTPMPAFLQFLSHWTNDGIAYEKLPRYLPYLALPIGMALLVFRLGQLALRLYQHDISLIIASHEVEPDTLHSTTSEKQP